MPWPNSGWTSGVASSHAPISVSDPTMAINDIKLPVEPVSTVRFQKWGNAAGLAVVLHPTPKRCFARLDSVLRFKPLSYLSQRQCLAVTNDASEMAIQVAHQVQATSRVASVTVASPRLVFQLVPAPTLRRTSVFQDGLSDVWSQMVVSRSLKPQSSKLNRARTCSVVLPNLTMGGSSRQPLSSVALLKFLPFRNCLTCDFRAHAMKSDAGAYKAMWSRALSFLRGLPNREAAFVRQPSSSSGVPGPSLSDCRFLTRPPRVATESR